MKRAVKPFILLSLITAAILIVKFTSVSHYSQLDNLQQLIASFGAFAPLFYMTFYTVGMIFFLPGTPITIAGGLFFGAVWGTIYIIIGATIGASCAFFVARFLGKSYVDKLLKNKFKKIDEYDTKLAEKGLITVLFFRLVPIFPFNGMNFALGLTRAKYKDFLLGTFFGIIPGSAILVGIGSSASKGLGLQFVGSLSLFGLLAIVPFMYKKYKARVPQPVLNEQ